MNANLSVGNRYAAATAYNTNISTGNTGINISAAFAKGGIFNSPTTFAMSGGRTGLLGEAGPEAIVPLERNSRGELGLSNPFQGFNTDGIVDALYSLKQEVAMLRAERSEDAKKVVVAVERTADASEETAETNSIMLKKESVTLVGRRTRSA
jgi:phage-related minor tail protein